MDTGPTWLGLAQVANKIPNQVMSALHFVVKNKRNAIQMACAQRPRFPLMFSPSIWQLTSSVNKFDGYN